MAVRLEEYGAVEKSNVKMRRTENVRRQTDIEKAQ